MMRQCRSLAVWLAPALLAGVATARASGPVGVVPNFSLNKYSQVDPHFLREVWRRDRFSLTAMHLIPQTPAILRGAYGLVTGRHVDAPSVSALGWEVAPPSARSYIPQQPSPVTLCDTEPTAFAACKLFLSGEGSGSTSLRSSGQRGPVRPPWLRTEVWR